MAKGDADGRRIERDVGSTAGAAQDNGPPGAEPAPQRRDWRTLHLWQIQGVRDVLVGLAIFGLLWLGYKLSIVTVPILLAMTLAYLFEPVVKWLTRPRGNRKGMNREAAASVIIAAAVLLVVVPLSFGLVFAIGQGIQVGGRIAQAVGHSANIVEAVERIGSPFNDEGQWVGFKAVAAAELEAAEREVSSDSAESESRTPPENPDAERVLAEAVKEGDGEVTLMDLAAAASRVEDDELVKLAAEADASWTALGEFSALRASFRWIILRFGDGSDAGSVSSLGRVLGWFATAIEANLQGIAQRGVSAAQAVIARVISFGTFLFMLFLTGFFFYFFSTSYGKVLGFWHGLIPEARKIRAVELAHQMDRVIAGFIRGRLTIAAIQALFFTIAYWLIGVPAPLIIGPLVAVLSIVPYVALIGVPITIVMMLVDSPTGFQSAWWWMVGAPVAVYFAGQALDDYVLTPVIQGKSTDMDTPSILFASIAGGVLAGLYGLLLAIPVAACLKIVMREVFWPRFRQWAEGKQRDFLPISGGESE